MTKRSLVRQELKCAFHSQISGFLIYLHLVLSCMSRFYIHTILLWPLCALMYSKKVHFIFKEELLRWIHKRKRRAPPLQFSHQTSISWWTEVVFLVCWCGKGYICSRCNKAALPACSLCFSYKLGLIVLIWRAWYIHLKESIHMEQLKDLYTHF